MKFIPILLFVLVFSLPALAAEPPAKPAPKPEAPAAKPAPDPKFNEPLVPTKPEEKKLAVLTDYDAAALNQWVQNQKEVPCGLACPKCGKELLLNTALLLNTNPPRKIVRCQDTEKCKWQGSAF